MNVPVKKNEGLRMGAGKRGLIAALPLLLFAAPGLVAQGKCPPLAEGVSCTAWHYHAMIWHPQDRTYREVSGIRQFVSLGACEKAKSEAAKEKASLAEFLKTNGDSSFQPDQFRDCHCDRTADPSSGVFLDRAARTAQRRIEHDAAWATREKLLSSENPRAADYLQTLFGSAARTDRYLRMIVPERLPEPGPPPSPRVLRDTNVGSAVERPVIGATLTFLDIVPEPEAATPPAVMMKEEVGDPAQGFFLHEFERADGILAASESLTEPDVKASVAREVVRRKRVLTNLRAVTRSSDPNGAATSALRLASDDEARLTIIRKLFGSDVAGAWAPSDPRTVATTVVIRGDVSAVMFDSTVDLDVRRRAFYAALGERLLSAAETASYVRIVEELVKQ